MIVLLNRIVPLKDKLGITITNTFQKILNRSNCKPNKIRVDKSSDFYNRSMKFWLQDNNIEMYSIFNEGKPVAAEGFIKTLKTKIYKNMTSISKNKYIEKLDDIANKYNNKYHSTIKIKPIDVKDKKAIIKILNFKSVILLEYQNIKIFLLKDILKIGLKKFL